MQHPGRASSVIAALPAPSAGAADADPADMPEPRQARSSMLRGLERLRRAMLTRPIGAPALCGDAARTPSPEPELLFSAPDPDC
jgi:hypothetical protein